MPSRTPQYLFRFYYSPFYYFQIKIPIIQLEDISTTGKLDFARKKSAISVLKLALIVSTADLVRQTKMRDGFLF